MSDIDDINELEGTDGERLKKKAVQMEGYEDDQQEEQQSELSDARSGNAFPDANIEIEDLDDNASQKTKISNIDLGNKLSNFKPYLQKIQFVQQEKKPQFSRAKIVMEIHLSLDSTNSKMDKILMLSLVKAILRKVLIRSVKGINKSFVIERKSNGRKEKVIQTEGINFDECYNNDEVFDLNRLETNDINQMMKHYGIEAARNSIVNEIRNVFGVYGIEVNYRHLSLVADFMTQNGTYKPFNRIGMQDSNSTFLKASYETSTSFLSDSCIKNELDDNTTPSSAIVLGQIPKIGTGVFDLLHDHTLE
jgi:DNA-directed RNA polymerase I subunit RPA1